MYDCKFKIDLRKNDLDKNHKVNNKKNQKKNEFSNFPYAKVNENES